MHNVGMTLSGPPAGSTITFYGICGRAFGEQGGRGSKSRERGVSKKLIGT